MYLFIYKTTHINGRYYIGRHQTTNLNDGYLGSGRWVRTINDKSALSREILQEASSFDELVKLEEEYISKHYNDPLCMNFTTVGTGFSSDDRKQYSYYADSTFSEDHTLYMHKKDIRVLSENLIDVGTKVVLIEDSNGDRYRVWNQNPKYLSGEFSAVVTARAVDDPDGKLMHVSKNDPRLLNGEMAFTFTGRVTVKDSDGKTYQVSKDDPRYLSGEFVGVQRGMMSVYDPLDPTIMLSVNIDDPRLKTQELVACGAGYAIVIDPKDSSGKKLKVSVDDPRYVSGELVGMMAETVTVKDPNNPELGSIRISIKDPRYRSGELVGVMKGFIIVKDPDDPTKPPFRISKDGELYQDYLNGKLVHVTRVEKATCPYCNARGAREKFKNAHFENCKYKYTKKRRSPPPKPMVSCVYCKKTGKLPGMRSEHMDNCKHRPS